MLLKRSSEFNRDTGRQQYRRPHRIPESLYSYSEYRGIVQVEDNDGGFGINRFGEPRPGIVAQHDEVVFPVV